MNKKLFSIVILTLLVLPLFASAQVEDGLLGGMDKEIFKAVGDIINYPIHIPAAQIYSNKTTQELTMPVWLLFAGFAIVFCTIWLASGFVPLFKAPENKKIRIFFVIGVTLITMFVTPVMLWIVKLTVAATTITYLLLLVLVGYTIWTIFRSGWASNSAQNAMSTRSLAEAAQLSAEAARQNKQTDVYKEKTKMAAERGLTQQIGAIRGLRTNLGALLGDFTSMRKAAIYPPNVKSHQAAMKKIDRISVDLGRITSFKTETDRVLAGMKTVDYREDAAIESLSSTTAPVWGSRKANIRQTVDTETNDLGRTIATIATELRGVLNEPLLKNLIGQTEAAINITHQMEKDIVLEEQMIEKM